MKLLCTFCSIAILSAILTILPVNTVQAQNYDNPKFFGPVVYLQNVHTRTLAMAWGGGGELVYGNSTNFGTWEQFEIWDINGGELRDGDIIALRTVNTRQFLSVNNGWQYLTADRSWARDAEQWVIRDKTNPGGVVRSGDTVTIASRPLGIELGFNLDAPNYPIGAWGYGGAWEQVWFIDKDENPTNRNNCVLYARSRVPSLPTGMSSYNDKYRKINVFKPGTRTPDPNAGLPRDVAIINTGSSTGHVAVVEQRHEDGTLTIREGNFPANIVRARRGTPSQLKIVGFFRP
jgi:hypothetical protein